MSEAIDKLFAAIDKRDVAEIKTILLKNPGCVNVVHSLSQLTPLQYALVEKGAHDLQAKCVLELIIRGADVNLCSGAFGNAPLHFAAYSNLVECIKILLAAGAKVTKKNSTDETPKHRALQVFRINRSSTIAAQTVELLDAAEQGIIPSREDVGLPDPNRRQTRLERLEAERASRNDEELQWGVAK